MPKNENQMEAAKRLLTLVNEAITVYKTEPASIEAVLGTSHRCAKELRDLCDACGETVPLTPFDVARHPLMTLFACTIAAMCGNDTKDTGRAQFSFSACLRMRDRLLLETTTIPLGSAGCFTCSGSGVHGKDRYGEDSPCPDCDGKGTKPLPPNLVVTSLPNDRRVQVAWIGYHNGGRYVTGFGSPFDSAEEAVAAATLLAEASPDRQFTITPVR